MNPIAWIRPCESEGAVLEWDKPRPSDCADPTPLYHGSDVDARIAELTADVARYKSDAARLDWCEANADHGSMPYYEDGKFNVTWLSRRAEGVCTSQFNSLREAIDIARNALKEGV